jgi:hypothetical protein
MGVQERGELVKSFELQGGTQLKVYVNGTVVTLVCSPPLNAPYDWQMPRLAMHWGVLQEGRGSWKLPSSKWQPEGTKNHKNRALQTELTALDPSGPHGGDYTVSVQLKDEKQVRALPLLSTHFLHNGLTTLVHPFATATTAAEVVKALCKDQGGCGVGTSESRAGMFSGCILMHRASLFADRARGEQRLSAPCVHTCVPLPCWATLQHRPTVRRCA